ncbi:MAG: glycine betaine/carnitine/choline transporter ATP-binding protein [Symbiobacteriaceae bacterium]|jgi:osmoprotectant transport system ATP-binding protein|nr:glycine betaine/carnitine/choline transporter ATP-binding protein [Symbiobacteriaceae bacterium]
MVRFEHVSKVYAGGQKAVDDLSLTIERGEFVCFIGPSGCGKTTTMKMINRLHEPTAGTISVNGQDIMQMDPVELRRSIGYVIQQIGLFPHMTIAQNVELVPRLLGWDAARRQQRINELMPMVGLDPAIYRDRYPKELSGGQQQRVGVIRALAAEPDLILMDEPFGALDPITRETLQDELKRLQAKLKKTIIFVTHDMDEALKLADRIVVMKEGRAHQVATPEELLRSPKDEFVAQFIGRDRLSENPSTLLVREIMHRRLVTVDPKHGIAEAVVTMRQRHVNSVLVTDEQDRLLGIVTAKEIEEVKRGTVADVMRTDVPTVLPDAHARDAIGRMYLDGLDHLPVVDEQRVLVGLITRSSVAEVLSRSAWQDGGAA